MNKQPNPNTPLTPYQRVRRANAVLVDRGGMRMPSGWLQPDVTEALRALVDAGYATTPLAVITTALLDAHRKIKRK